MATRADIGNVSKLLTRHVASVERQIKRGVLASTRRGRQLLVRATPKDRQDAQHGWKVYPGKGADLATLMNSTPYIGILEKGARPHKVSAEGRFAIYQWVERHFRMRASGALVSGRDVGEGDQVRRMSERRSRAFGFARAREQLTSAGAFTRKLIVEKFPDYESRLIPEALNITGSICRKLNLKGQKPLYFTRNSLPELTTFCREEVQRCLAEIGERGGQA